jgi:serine/threonine-protein kinase RsbW
MGAGPTPVKPRAAPDRRRQLLVSGPFTQLEPSGIILIIDAMMTDRLSINVPCDLRFRNAVGALLQQVCNRLEQEGAAPGTGFQVVSAFNEAFNNLTQYAYPDGEGPVEVVLEILTTELVLSLVDWGRSFEFESVTEPDIEDLPESGLGIYIIRAAMDRVQYTPARAGGRNVLRMTKDLQAPLPDAPEVGFEPSQGTYDDA